MKKDYVPYTILGLVGLAILAVAAVMLLHKTDATKNKPATSTVTQPKHYTAVEAGNILANTVNQANSGIQVTRVVACAENPANAGEYACYLVVAQGTKTECDGVRFTIRKERLEVKGSSMVDSKNCA
jgi:hypothetical protein